MSKEAYYFKHFCNARNDRKIRKARLQLGIEAYALYFMLLEVLREEKYFKYPISDLDVLASEFDTSIQKLDVLIRGYDLFVLDQKNMFFSIAQIEGLKSWIELKEMNRLKGIKSGISRKKKIQNQIEILSHFDSNEPQFNSGSTTVELREEKKRDDKKDIIKYSTSKRIEQFEKFVSWIRSIYLNKKILDNSIQIENDLAFMKHQNLSVAENGKLYDTKTLNDFSFEQADLIWKWLYNHQEQVLSIEGNK